MKFQFIFSFTFALLCTLVRSREMVQGSGSFYLILKNVEEFASEMKTKQQKVSGPYSNFTLDLPPSPAIGISSTSNLDWVGANVATELQVTVEGWLTSTSSNGETSYAVVSDDKNTPLSFTKDSSGATEGFSIADGKLTLDGSDSFSMNVNSNKITVHGQSQNEVSDDFHVLFSLNAVDSTGNAISDYTPSGRNKLMKRKSNSPNENSSKNNSSNENSSKNNSSKNNSSKNNSSKNNSSNENSSKNNSSNENSSKNNSSKNNSSNENSSKNNSSKDNASQNNSPKNGASDSPVSCTTQYPSAQQSGSPYFPNHNATKSELENISPYSIVASHASQVVDEGLYRHRTTLYPDSTKH